MLVVLYLNCGEIPMNKAKAHLDEARLSLVNQYPSAKILVLQVRDQHTRVEFIKEPLFQRLTDFIHNSLHR